MDLKTSELLDLATKHRDQDDVFVRTLLNLRKRVYKVPDNLFSPEKFMARYSLQESDFSAIPLAGQLFVSIVNDSVKIDDPPIFDVPDQPKSIEEHAGELVDVLPGVTPEARTALIDALVRFVKEIR